MRVVAGVLILLLAPEAAVPPASPPLPAVRPPDPADQEWLADPILPAVLSDLPEEALRFEVPPLSALSRPPGQDPGPIPEESSFPRAISGREIQAWREERDLRAIRELSSDALLGIPLIVPQLA